MIVGLVSRAVCNVSCYLYPAYASYKALSATPVSNPEATRDVERWLMYWSVVGTWTGLEGLAGFLFTWIPLYSFFKMLFFLYLSLPQTQGSTYIYSTQLAPVFQEHERDIDSFLSSLRYRAGGFLTTSIAWAWDKVRSQANLGSAPQQGDFPQPPTGGDPYMHQQQPPTLANPASGAVQQMYSLATRYAVQYIPVAVAAMRPAGQRSTERGFAVPEPPQEGSIPMPIPHPTPSRPSDPDMSVRSRISSHSDMGYEEIAREEADNSASARPALGEHGSGSWFGWGAQTPREKTE